MTDLTVDAGGQVWPSDDRGSVTDPAACRDCGHPAGEHWQDDHRHCGRCPGPRHHCGGREAIAAELDRLGVPPAEQGTYVTALEQTPGVLGLLAECVTLGDVQGLAERGRLVDG